MPIQAPPTLQSHIFALVSRHFTAASHMYLDAKDFVCVGLGHRVYSVTDAIELFHDQPAHEVTCDFETVAISRPKRKGRPSNDPAKKGANLTTVRLSEEGFHQTVSDQIVDIRSTLEDALGDGFEKSTPVGVVLALNLLMWPGYSKLNPEVTLLVRAQAYEKLAEFPFEAPRHIRRQVRQLFADVVDEIKTRALESRTEATSGKAPDAIAT